MQRISQRVETINWGDFKNNTTVHDYIEINQKNSIKNAKLKYEVNLLSSLSKYETSCLIKFFIQAETLFESWGIPNMDSKTGLFYNMPIKHIEAPIQYSRALLSYDQGQNPKEMQFNFLSNLKNKRFKQIQKIVGAYQGKERLNHNQLLDAFHIWCTEHNKCDYFLTLDFKLIKMVSNCQSQQIMVNLITPSKLIKKLNNKIALCDEIDL